MKTELSHATVELIAQRVEIETLKAELKKLDAENAVYAALIADLQERINEMIGDAK